MESLPRIGDGDGLVPGPSSFGCRRTVRFVGAPNDNLSGSAMPAMGLRCLRHDRARERGREQHRATVRAPCRRLESILTEPGSPLVAKSSPSTRLARRRGYDLAPCATSIRRQRSVWQPPFTIVLDGISAIRHVSASRAQR